MTKTPWDTVYDFLTDIDNDVPQSVIEAFRVCSNDNAHEAFVLLEQWADWYDRVVQTRDGWPFAAVGRPSPLAQRSRALAAAQVKP